MRVRIVGDIVILEPQGELTTNNGARELGDKISDLIGLAQNKILLNLHGIRHADIGGIEALLVAYYAAADNGGRLKFFGPTGEIKYLLSMTKLSRTFDIYPDEQMAIASFQ